MAFRLSDAKSRLLALIGSGILVGTALAIIIPEGIDSLYFQQQQPPPPDSVISANGSHIDHHYDILAKASDDKSSSPRTLSIGLSLVAGFVLMLFIDQFSIYQGAEHSHSRRPSANSSTAKYHQDYALANQNEDTDEDDDDEDVIVYSKDETLSTTILATNEIGNESEIDTNKDLDSHRVSINGNHEMKSSGNVSKGNKHRSNYDLQSEPHLQIKSTRQKNTKVTPTLGLVIHAAADGIALGAAATTSHREVEMIIFLAIMLHKGPAAFSLVVFLLHRGIKHSTIRRHLLAFSLSAPLAALVTYFGLSQSGKEALRQNNATGIAMLFSAGTFLYVATVHVLPELVHNKLLTPKELIFLVGGAFLPILLAQTI